VSNTKKNFEHVRAVIPVAGVGTRLRPLTHTLPKVLIPVAGKPMLAHILDEIEKMGIKKVSIVIGYLGDQIKDYVLKNYAFDVDFVEQDECLGLGHAIAITRDTLQKGEELLIVLGDTLFKANLERIMSTEDSVVCVKEVSQPQRFGVVVTKGPHITDLIEKPDRPVSNLAIVGIYYIKEPSIMYEALDHIMKEDIKTKGEYQLTDALKIMLSKEVSMQYHIIDGWYDCGKPETLLHTNQQLLEKYKDAVRFEHRENGVVIIHPVSIGLDVSISQAIIGPYVTIGDKVKINRTVMSDSIVNKGSEVEDIVLSQSIIGENAIVRGSQFHLNVGDSTIIDFLNNSSKRGGNR